VKDQAIRNGPERYDEWAEPWDEPPRSTHAAQDGSELGMQRAMDTLLRVRYGAPTPRPEWTRVMEAIADQPASSTLRRYWRWAPVAAIAAVAAVAVLAYVLHGLSPGSGEVHVLPERQKDEQKEDRRTQNEVSKPLSEGVGGGERSAYEAYETSNQENEKEAEMKIESMMAAGMVMAMLTNVTAVEQATIAESKGAVAVKVAISSLDGVVESRDHVVLNLLAKPVGGGEAEKVTVLLTETTRIQSYGRGQEVANKLTMASLVKGVQVMVLAKEREDGKKEALTVVVKE
jgi:hypothetical protein